MKATPYVTKANYYCSEWHQTGLPWTKGNYKMDFIQTDGIFLAKIMSNGF